MKKQNNIWIGTDQLKADPEYVAQQKAEFADPMANAADLAEHPKVEASRRDFLKYLGFGISAATIAACDIPVRQAIPYVSKPDTIVPGVATYYASTYVKGSEYCPVIVKTREGRPIKIEGNTLSGMTRGGTTARSQASVLDMYDTSRFDGPYRIVDGEIIANRRNRAENPSWAEIDTEIKRKLNANSVVRFVSHTEMSPSKSAAIEEFKLAYPNAQHVQYDPVSAAALLDANQAYFGQRAIPAYRFDKAKYIVSIDADFLGTWISPTEYSHQYGETRQVIHGKEMSHHIHVESNMSLTGSVADNRILLRPSQIGQFVVALAHELGVTSASANLPEDLKEKAAILGRHLSAANHEALVVCGTNNLSEQLLVNAINEKLGSYGHTIMTDRWCKLYQGSDQALAKLVDELEAGTVDALIVLDAANPVYDNPYASRIKAALSQVDLKVSLASIPDETTMSCDYVAPNHNYLENWGDAEPMQGHFSLMQPTIQPIFASVGRPGTRSETETILRWADSAKLDVNAEQPLYQYLKQYWQDNIFGRQTDFVSFQTFWDSALQDGVVTVPVAAATAGEGIDAVAAGLSRGELLRQAPGKVTQPIDGQEVTVYETIMMGNGNFGNNPWLHELPDPVNRTCWGNYLAIPMSWDGSTSFQAYNGLNEEEFKGKADMVELSVGDKKVIATAVRQFGLKPDTFAIPLGFGRQVTGIVGRALGNGIGIDVYPMLPVDEDGYVQYYLTEAAVSDKVGTEEQFASVQYHHSIGLTDTNEEGTLYVDKETGEQVRIAGDLTPEQEEQYNEFNVDEHTIMSFGSGMQGGLTKRSIIYEGDADDLEALKDEIADFRAHANHLNDQTLYPFEEFAEDVYSQGHWWALHIDLNTCTGCGACEIACSAENNVPVVGKYEVWRHHEMKWLRIDRYFYGDYENPTAVYQPMMCQHCDNAPCENVCPVNATNHSNEGLNQMTYNRCIGTRYCANNCPYKVRRFNWLDYTTADLFASNEPTVSGEELPFGADNLTRMVLNPDVTVRSRGVIEKCSFCAQGLQQAKLTAKIEKRRLRDSDLQAACVSACPTGGITFGDRNDPNSAVSKLIDNPFNYRVLEEINVQSSVFYAAKVRNSIKELEA